MWFDPARWNAMIAPHWNPHQQLGTFTTFQLFYVQSLTPLLFFVLLITTTPRGRRRDAWWNGWVVYVPAVAGIVAYSLVIVTARYVMPFVLAGTLTLLATLPRPRRMLPLYAVLGVVVPIGLEAMSADTAYGLTLVAACVAAMAVGALVTTRSRVAWGIVVLVAFLIARILLPPSAPEIVRVGALLAAVMFWFSARARCARAERFISRDGGSGGLALVLAGVFALRLEIRLKQDGRASPRGTAGMERSAQIAADLALHGIRRERGSRSLDRRRVVLGSICAPGRRTTRRGMSFWQLSSAARDSLLAIRFDRGDSGRCVDRSRRWSARQLVDAVRYAAGLDACRLEAPRLYWNSKSSPSSAAWAHPRVSARWNADRA
jgi:hypothetical protein